MHGTFFSDFPGFPGFQEHVGNPVLQASNWEDIPYLSLNIATPQQFINNQQGTMSPVISCQLLLSTNGLVKMFFCLIKTLLQCNFTISMA